MPRPRDTSPDIEEKMFEAFRAMSFEKKLWIMGDAYRTGRMLHATGFVSRNPGAGTAEINRDWVLKTWGELPQDTAAMGWQSLDSLAVLQQTMTAFRNLGIAAAVGGSWASGAYGEPRFTRNADVVVAPFPGKEELLAGDLGPDFYCSADAMRMANQTRSSFNILHPVSGFKIDIFVRRDRPFEQMLLTRSSRRELTETGGVRLEMVSAEDIVLLKLEWYRLGDEVSEQQWRDVRGVLKTKGTELDFEYLDKWAAEIGVADLLVKARLDV